MFIETGFEQDRAPAERNVPAMMRRSGFHFAPLERGSFGSRATYKHYVPTGPGSLVIQNLAKESKICGPD
jgi:hypothetical protein